MTEQALTDLIRADFHSVTTLRIVRSLDGGYTDAQVLLCDIQSAPTADPGQALNGQFIVKVSAAPQSQQAAAHREFCLRLSAFADDHVPRLLTTATDGETSADVYQIAGESLRSVRTAERADYRDLPEVCGRVAADLLVAQLRAEMEVDHTSTVQQVLEELLGPGFPANQRGERLAGVAALAGAQDDVFLIDGEFLVNPTRIALAGTNLGRAQPIFLRGRSHGDLHLRNILVQGSLQDRDLGYFVIDVNWDVDSALLYDQAYLEVGALLTCLTQNERGLSLSVLAAVDNERVSRPAVYAFDQGTIELVSKVRKATVTALEECEPHRRDVWEHQYLLARLAAALNWASKPITPDLQKAAFLVAAWTGRRLLQRHHDEQWQELLKAHSTRATLTVEQSRTAPELTSDEVRDRLAPFFSPDHSGLELFLVADEGLDAPQLANLARGRWSAVIDTDPDSDQGFLASHLLPALGERRSAVVFGLNTQMGPVRESTHWLMANGWTTRAEARPDSFPEWRRRYRPHVRSLVDHVFDETPNKEAAVLCLRSGRNDQLIDRVLEEIEDRYDGSIQVVELWIEAADVSQRISPVLDVLADLAPVSVAGLEPTLPGLNGPVSIGRGDLRRLAVDLDVLHSARLTEELAAEPPSDEFWRGRPPTWLDIDAGRDVPRDAQPGLQQELQTLLQGHRTQVVELSHSPGAGGTTLSRRVAWDLHERHPTVVLLNYSGDTAERLDELIQLTGLPLLVVADSAVISDGDLQDLEYALQDRNARAVILQVTRTNQLTPAPHGLADPMSQSERRSFADTYLPRAQTDRARRELGTLATALDKPAQYLSPFYFGLCTYESEFEGIESYVKNHLSALGFQQRKIALYLALATRYSQIGVPIPLVRRWITGRWTSSVPDRGIDEELREILGPDLRHLVVTSGGQLRLLHPRIAENVLVEILGNGDQQRWKARLGDSATELIDQVSTHLGPDDPQARRLLAELFVRRRGWDEPQQGARNFAELILDMPASESAHRVLLHLTEQCPNEPHFWNHLGRYQIYELRSDYAKAEEYLQRAIELSEGRDPTQFHTLGMVRRFWIEESLRQVQQSGDGTSPDQLIGDVSARLELAMDAFEQARTLAPYDDHGYITPVQLIVTIFESLVRASGHDSLPELVQADPSVGAWIAGQLNSAESLLEQNRLARGGRRADPGRYMQLIEARLNELYGDVDALIQQWRAVLNGAEDKTTIGRALARSYFARAGRDWSTLTENDLREMETLFDYAIRNSSASEADVRNWFQCYRRLPEYQEYRALERFASIAATIDSLEANYYLYVLRFLRWLRGEENSQDAVRRHLEECRRLARGRRRQWSYEWISVGRNQCPLVHFTELGQWRGEPEVWERSGLLDRVGGVINQIAGPQAGRIRVGNGQMTAFFTPGTRFVRTRDVNALVEFYLGFSYEGMRAWRVGRPGAKHSTEGPSKAHPEPAGESVPPPQRSTSPPDDESEAPAATLPHTRQAAPTSPARSEDQMYRTCILALVQQAQPTGQPLTSLQLGNALIDRFGMSGYHSFCGEGTLRNAVERLGFAISETEVPGRFDISLPDAASDD